MGAMRIIMITSLIMPMPNTPIYPLRLPRVLRILAEEQAKKEGVSLAVWIKNLIKESLLNPN